MRKKAVKQNFGGFGGELYPFIHFLSVSAIFHGIIVNFYHEGW